MLSNLLIYRFALFNISAFLCLAWAWQQGHIAPLLQGGGREIVLGIAALFAAVWGTTLWRVLRVGRDLNRLKRGDAFPANGHLRDKAFAKVRWLQDASNWLPTLGLIGTVIGFSFALSGVVLDALQQAAGVQEMIGTLMSGLYIALNTTIAGAILGLWNEYNQRLLQTAMVCFWADALGQDE